MIDPMPVQEYLLDVRTPAEFATGALPGAENVEYQDIVRFVVDQRGVDKDSAITLYCRSGRRSAIAKAELDSLGFRNVKDWGGLEDAQTSFDEQRSQQQMKNREEKKQTVATKLDREKLKKSTSVLLNGLRELE